jgi:hypothetical protein
MDNELERMCKESFVAKFKVLSLEGLKKTTKNLSGWPVSWPRFEHKTFQTQNRSVGHTMYLEVVLILTDTVVLFLVFSIIMAVARIKVRTN